MLIPGRNFGINYRYGFNGQEMDNEIIGTGNSYTAEYWQYDVRLVRRWNLDPVDQISISNYATFKNNPNYFIDPKGDNAGDYYSSTGDYLGSDGINDNKIYLVDDETVQEFALYARSSMVNTTPVYLSDINGVSYVGTMNDFGLIQVTRMGHPNILNNEGREDKYSYKMKDGTKSSVGKHGDDWMTPKAASGFYGAVSRFIEKNGNVNIVFNDASAYNPTFNLGHSSTGGHSKGTAFDIRFLTQDGKGSNNINSLSATDKEFNTKFINELKKSGFKTFYSDQGKISGTKHANDHTDHLHGEQ
jgi:RHS repeat-associated protein